MTETALIFFGLLIMSYLIMAGDYSEPIFNLVGVLGLLVAVCYFLYYTLEDLCITLGIVQQ